MGEEISDKCRTSGISKEECITSENCDCVNPWMREPQPVYILINGKMVPSEETTENVKRRWDTLLTENYQND